jgi:hypothetical protein
MLEEWVQDGDGFETFVQDDVEVSRCISCGGFLVTAPVASPGQLSNALDVLRYLSAKALQKHGQIELHLDVQCRKPRKKQARRKR